MAHTFRLNPKSLLRRFAVYVVIAKGQSDVKLYVGKTGDNREGCNPVISRCGNHFSYNRIHSQLRNKLQDHELRDYIYVFDHFDEYTDHAPLRRKRIDRINEMERWLRTEIFELVKNQPGHELLNRQGKTYLKSPEKEKRAAFRTLECEVRINKIVQAVKKELKTKTTK